jgi:hypothetical protein
MYFNRLTAPSLSLVAFERMRSEEKTETVRKKISQKDFKKVTRHFPSVKVIHEIILILYKNKRAIGCNKGVIVASSIFEFKSLKC